MGRIASSIPQDLNTEGPTVRMEGDIHPPPNEYALQLRNNSIKLSERLEMAARSILEIRSKHTRVVNHLQQHDAALDAKLDSRVFK